jgi:hypothetical protein
VKTASGAGCEYLVPIKWDDDDALPEFTAYLAEVAARMPVTVVDGSPEPLRRHHHDAWRGIVARHLSAPGRARNGKADGVLAGLAATTAHVVVIADDDVRWQPPQLSEAVALMADADIVRPQNVFDPMPWHARWDSARSLINRSVHSDFPGTLVIRRSALPLDETGAPHYDGDVLFENLELIRTVTARGGREVRADGLYVRRRPPTVRRFGEQRVRQAYDSAAQPWRMIVELALLPVVVLSRQPGRVSLVLAGASILLAALGRRRAGGQKVYSSSSVAWAPVWMLERSVCAWIALAQRARGGVPYRGERLRVAAHSVTRLAERYGRA